MELVENLKMLLNTEYLIVRTLYEGVHFLFGILCASVEISV